MDLNDLEFEYNFIDFGELQSQKVNIYKFKDLLYLWYCLFTLKSSKKCVFDGECKFIDCKKTESSLKMFYSKFVKRCPGQMTQIHY